MPQLLDNCRSAADAIRALPAVFLDPGYSYSIRAYRYEGRSTIGLTESEIRSVLQSPEFDRLTYLSGKTGTHIVQKWKGKGTAARFVKEYLGNKARIYAIGNSGDDAPMLEACDYAYATARSSRALRRLAKEGRCHILKRDRQAGLLEAAHHRLKSDAAALPTSSSVCSRLQSNHLLKTLLEVADRA